MHFSEKEGDIRLRILGIDPGTAITGYGLIETEGAKLHLLDYGCIRTPAHMPLPERLVMIDAAANVLLEQAQAEQVAVEQLFFNRNTTTAFTVAQARGVLVLAAAKRGLPLAEYTPLQVKQAIVGYGRAEKQQIQYMVAKMLAMREIPRPDDAADALAIAICHAHYYKTRRLRGEERQ